MKNACIVGLGAIGPIHAHAVSETKYANVYAVCDIDKDRADKYAKLYSAKVYSDFDGVLSDKSIDSIHICTPHYLHKDMAVKALLSGKNIVLEKPAAMTLNELDELKDIYEKSNAKACIMLQNRKNTSVKKLNYLIQNDKSLGRLKGMTGFMTWNRTKEYYDSAKWRGSWRYEGGGLLINQAMHLIDLIDTLGGGITEIKPNISNNSIASIEVEDTAEALFRLKNGATAVFYATNAFPLDVPFRLEMFFEHAALRYADNKLYRITDDVEIISSDVQIIDGKKCWGGGHRVVIDEFYKALENNTNDYIDLCSGLHSAKVMLSMYKNGLNLGKEWIMI